MKKLNPKQKVITNNQKISSFFNRISKEVSSKTHQNATNTEINIDIIPATPELNNKRQKSHILNTITNRDECSKRKITSPVDHVTKSPPKKKLNGGRENVNVGISSNSSANGVGIHLSNEDVVCSPQKKLIESVTANKSKDCLDAKETSHERCGTPCQGFPRTPTKTPNKRRSPRKLYSKSPKASEFNVEVIENYVKITPSKSSLRPSSTILRSNSPKKQISILKYVSPSSSKCKQVQNLNESTPEKSPTKQFLCNSSLKVKKNLNLEFASTSLDEVDNINIKENILLQGLDRTTEEMGLLLSLEDSWEGSDIQIYTLDLGSIQYCKVTDLIRTKYAINITVEGSKNNEKAVCSLEGFWMWSKLEVGCTVYMTAVKEDDIWKITNDHGFMIYEPDILISNTAVVGALFCKRRSVLKEKFTGFEPENKIMIIGVIIHTLLQSALQMKCVNSQQIEDILDKTLASRSIVRKMYNASLTLEDIRSELILFVPRILKFIKDYVLQQKSSVCLENNWRGTIDSIQDIEENIWCPEMGIKGKVDVSISSGENILPVEVKTGRATVSLEHRGQVMLYIIMMAKLGYNVSSGLLLYIREGVLREIPYSEKEKRDLILLRNELTYYLRRRVRLNGSNEVSSSSEEFSRSQKFNTLEAAELPEPINHHSACEKCPYNIICCSYLRNQNVDISNNKVLNGIKHNNLSHLSDLHIQYFIHFCNLLDLEGSEKSGKDVSVIYTKTPQERETYGKCITFVKVTKEVIECNNLHEHTFEKIDTQYTGSFFTSGIEESNYVVVSTNQRPAVAAGLVSYVDHKIIVITLDRNLNLKYPNSVFHIDSYNSTSAFSYNFSSLSIMLEATDKAERIRRLLIDKETPTFKLKLPKVVASKAPPILKKLNKAQQRAAIRAIAANDYLLIKGMPGAGKTATIVALVQLLVELGNSVLITSHTHAAVDNVCVRLKKFGINVLRLGSLGKIHPEIQPLSEYELIKDCKTPEELERIYNNAQVLAVTCLGTKHPLFQKRTVDICIVDESTQILQCTLFRAISISKKFILIGDPDQLTPVVRNKDAQKYGLRQSLFERLQNHKNTATLNINYRMNNSLTQLANSFTYKGELEIANDTIGCATLKIPDLNLILREYEEQQWLIETLDQSLDKAIQVLDTGPVWHITESESNGNQYINKSEIHIVTSIVAALIRGNVPRKSIGVISPYTVQVAELSIVLKDIGIDVSTIDQFQGRDKEIIIFSCALSKNQEKLVSISQYHILEDRKRLNVAITRAKHKLIFVCDLETIKNYTPFRELFQHVPQQNFIRLKSGEKGFNWKSDI